MLWWTYGCGMYRIIGPKYCFVSCSIQKDLVVMWHTLVFFHGAGCYAKTKKTAFTLQCLIRVINIFALL